ncbi:succinate dehydrogenase assembly factor 2 [Limoniibacter endophyticus]|uniref:FAD assembly factor SdhE n=1 Tax=Limoniibacter endophyticus TaxID=1565040 RepID=A0A8J3DLX6_9HYPH|nr:succinate dehydrogenase assembly factor 2 [Limoniibacter endophyticus]GHC61815.1 hypothetical protein GCM10010136_02620 [Limoniibacter endophyticus]
MTGTTRSSANLDVTRRRLLFRSWHRGMREVDLILGTFADAHIADMADEEIRLYEALIEANDQHLLSWFTGERPIDPEFDTPIFHKIMAHRQTLSF